MAMDATNATSPQPGYKLSGESYRAAAIKRLKKLQEAGSSPMYSLLPPSKKP